MSRKEWRRFASEWTANGFPWCDKCGKPAVMVAGHAMHATPEWMRGVPRDEDQSGHHVTIYDWEEFCRMPDAGELDVWVSTLHVQPEAPE